MGAGTAAGGSGLEEEHAGLCAAVAPVERVRWRAEVCAVVARADAHGGTGLDAAPAAALDRVARVAAVRANIIFRRSDKWR